MNKGVRALLCIIAIVLIMMVELGVPAKFTKLNSLRYIILFVGFLMMTDSL